MGSNPPLPEFARPVEVARIGPSGLSFKVEADAVERERLARRLGVSELRRLEADIGLMPRGAGVALTATWRVEIVQECVVTLEPIESVLGETFDLVYGPGAAEDEKAGAEIEVDLEAADPPEPIRDGRIDVGEAVVEQVALAIDPYPRKPGAVFESPAETDETEENPFAALRGLKARQ